MINCKGCKVNHTKYGDGVIVECEGDRIKINFGCNLGEKTFKYPECFEKHIHFTEKEESVFFETALIEEKKELENAKFEKKFGSRKKFLEELNKYGFEGFHHYTNFPNLISILQDGKLYSRNLANKKQSGFWNSAETTIIHHTSEYVTNHVRFYYKEKTPTLFRNEGIKNIVDGNDDGYLAHMPIPVLLLFDKSLVYEEGVAISDGGCGNNHTTITENFNTAIDFDWENVFARCAYKEPESEEDVDYKRMLINKRNAEFLIPNEVCLDKLTAIVFRSMADKKHAEYITGPNELYQINPTKFIVGNGYPDNRNYLKDYVIQKTYNRDNVVLFFDSSPVGYSHKVNIYYSDSRKECYDLPNTYIQGNTIRLWVNRFNSREYVEYLLNDNVSAIWR